MSEQDNIRTLEMTFDALNAHDMAKAREYHAPGYTVQGPGMAGPVSSGEEAAYMQVYFDAFPNLHFEVTHTIAQGDFVVANWVATGTHEGPLRTPSGGSFPATGREGSNYGSSTTEFENGKVAHTRSVFDVAGMLAQLGLMPDM